MCMHTHTHAHTHKHTAITSSPTLVTWLLGKLKNICILPYIYICALFISFSSFSPCFTSAGNNLKQCSVHQWSNWVGVAPCFSSDSCTVHEHENIKLLLCSMKVSHNYEHTGGLVEKICSLWQSISAVICSKMLLSSNNHATRDTAIAACVSWQELGQGGRALWLVNWSELLLNFELKTDNQFWVFNVTCIAFRTFLIEKQIPANSCIWANWWLVRVEWVRLMDSGKSGLGAMLLFIYLLIIYMNHDLCVMHWPPSCGHWGSQAPPGVRSRECTATDA